MLVDHLFQCRISPWPKTAEKRGFCTGVTDRPTDGRTDRRTDGPTNQRTRPLIEMRRWCEESEGFRYLAAGNVELFCGRTGDATQFLYHMKIFFFLQDNELIVNTLF